MFENENIEKSLKKNQDRSKIAITDSAHFGKC